MMGLALAGFTEAGSDPGIRDLNTSFDKVSLPQSIPLSNYSFWIERLKSLASAKDVKDVLSQVYGWRLETAANFSVHIIARVITEGNAIQISNPPLLIDFDYEEALAFALSVADELDRRRVAAAQAEIAYWSFLEENDE